MRASVISHDAVQLLLVYAPTLLITNARMELVARSRCATNKSKDWKWDRQSQLDVGGN